MFGRCSGHALVVATDVALQSGVSTWRRRVVVQFFLLLLCFLFPRGKPCVARSIMRELFSSSCGTVPESNWTNCVSRQVAVRQDLWRRLANNDRDVV